MSKPVELRRLAAADIDAALAHYLAEAGEDIAHRLIADLEAAFAHLSEHPASGSLRWSYELGIPELRNWMMERFLYVVFYVDRADSVDVWRILHARRDIAASLVSLE